MSKNPDNPSSNLNTPDCDELRLLLPAYMIGATTPEEAQQVKRLLPVCPDVEDDLEIYASLINDLTARVEAVEPPAHLRKIFLDRVAAEETAIMPPQNKTKALDMLPSVKRRPVAWGTVAAVFVLLISNAYWLLRVTTIEQDFSSLNEQKQTIVTLLNAEKLQRITLQSTANAEALGYVFWNPETQDGTFYTDRLPTLDESHTYQVWLIQGDQPMSAGIFEVDASGESLLTFTPEEDLQSFDAIAISIEPAGGSPLPTTDPIALGDVTAT